jgi:hypothetical protein
MYLYVPFLAAHVRLRTVEDWNKWHRNTTSRGALPKIYFLNQSGLCTNQSSFTITIVNDLNTITPVSSSYCSIRASRFTLWQVFHPKRNKYSWKYRTCSWNLNKHSWNKHYLCLVWRYNRNSCTREKFFTITIIPFLHYQNIQTSLAALLTRYQPTQMEVFTIQIQIKVCQ